MSCLYFAVLADVDPGLVPESDQPPRGDVDQGMQLPGNIDDVCCPFWNMCNHATGHCDGEHHVSLQYRSQPPPPFSCSPKWKGLRPRDDAFIFSFVAVVVLLDSTNGSSLVKIATKNIQQSHELTVLSLSGHLRDDADPGPEVEGQEAGHLHENQARRKRSAIAARIVTGRRNAARARMKKPRKTTRWVVHQNTP